MPVSFSIEDGKWLEIGDGYKTLKSKPLYKSISNKLVKIHDGLRFYCLDVSLYDVADFENCDMELFRLQMNNAINKSINSWGRTKFFKVPYHIDQLKDKPKIIDKKLVDKFLRREPLTY